MARRSGIRRTAVGQHDEDYTPEQLEFMRALDKFKRDSHRPFPTCSEVLQVLLSLGYRKQKEKE